MIGKIKYLLAQDNTSIQMFGRDAVIIIKDGSRLLQGYDTFDLIMDPSQRVIKVADQYSTIVDALWSASNWAATTKYNIDCEYRKLRSLLVATIVKKEMSAEVNSSLWYVTKKRLLCDEDFNKSYSEHDILDIILQLEMTDQLVYNQILSYAEIRPILDEYLNRNHLTPVNSTTTVENQPTNQPSDLIIFCSKPITKSELFLASKPSDSTAEEFITNCNRGYQGILTDLQSLVSVAKVKGIANTDELLESYKLGMQSRYQKIFSTTLARSSEFAFSILYSNIVAVDPSVSKYFFTKSEIAGTAEIARTSSPNISQFGTTKEFH